MMIKRMSDYMIGIKLQKNKKISITKEISTIDSPRYVYIPLANGMDYNVTVLVKKDEYVCKGQIIARTRGNHTISLFSSVSGTVIDFVEKVRRDGKKVKCVVIENDFHEREAEKRNIVSSITNYTKEEFIKRLHDCGIVGLGGKTFPTYIKYQNVKDFKTLIVNAVECEPYITADYMLLKTKIEEILECCDAIMEIFHIGECFIAITVHNDELKEIIKSFIGTYPKIKIIEVPDLYPMGFEKTLVRYIKHIDYNDLPLEKGIIVNNVATVYAIYEALKYNKPLIERVVTISGNICEKPKNIYVKIGTCVEEILNQFNQKEDYTLILGGPMMGCEVNLKDGIISSDTNCILITEKINHDLDTECLRCGKCVRVCPVKLSPVLIKDYINNKKRLKRLDVQKCLECGLCSYVCPAKIPVREFVKEAKQTVREEDMK